MFQQIGVIRALGSLPGVREIACYRPEAWRRQLTRNPHAKDDEVANILKIRLSVEVLEQYGRNDGSHVLDAMGVALVWLDQWAMVSRELKAYENNHPN